MQSFTNELKAIEMKLTSAYDCQTVVDFFMGGVFGFPSFKIFSKISHTACRQQKSRGSRCGLCTGVNSNCYLFPLII